MHTLSSARRTCMALSSAVECTATVLMPISRQARWMRSAISPRLAMSTLSNMRTALADAYSAKRGQTPFQPMRIGGSFAVESEKGPDPFLRQTGHVRPFALFDDHQRVAVFDRLLVLDQHLLQDSGARRFDLVEGLHRLDQHQGLALLHAVADRDEGRRAGLGREIAGAHHRRFHRARVR